VKRVKELPENAQNQSRLTQRSSTILSAVGFAASEFLKSTQWKDTLDDVLQQLGTAVRANRAYYFENSIN